MIQDAIVIRSMLFADVVGFSKLSDAAYPGFAREFLAEAQTVLSNERHQAIVRNTWGDAIFAVFHKPSEAAWAALELQKIVQAIPWHERFGVPKGSADLRLRIGLHAGPVHEGFDAITQTKTFIGRHTNLAARIEPIAEEGSVYVSSEFAALATLEGDGDLQFEYVGQRPLPKNAGVIPMYRLSSRLPQPL